ncbi:MAG: hypothetical protein II721_03600 [Bacilli bacterium]|nr:hypothetical protein [Bacilli bacterium]
MTEKKNETTTLNGNTHSSSRIGWITMKEKEPYIDPCKHTGIRSCFEKGIDDKVRAEIKRLLRYLSKHFFFPIRYNLYFLNKEHFVRPEDGYCAYSAFYGNGRAKRNTYPRLYVPAKESDGNLLLEILFHVCYGVAKYYQWFFKEEKIRTEKKLDKEASDEADNHVKEFFEYEFGEGFNETLSANQIKERIIRHYVYSIEAKRHLIDHMDDIGALQLATVVLESNEKDGAPILKALRRVATSDYERKLLGIAAKEIQRIGYTDNASQRFYEKNDPRNSKPAFVFCEPIDLPIVFRRFDLACYCASGKFLNVLIGEPPDKKSTKEYGDLCYLSYSLNKEIAGPEGLFEIHLHPHVTDLNRIGLEDLSPREKRVYESLMKVLI